MKWVFQKAMPLVIVGAAFVSGFWLERRVLWSPTDVSIVIENLARQNINSILLEHDGSWAQGRLHGHLEMNPPSYGQSLAFIYPQPGEGSFRLVVKLADGRVVEGLDGYVEPGANCDFTITDIGVEAQCRHWENDLALAVSSLFL